MRGACRLLTVGPSPVSVSQAKAQLRVMHCLEDDAICLLIDAATEAIENLTGRQLRPSTAILTLDSFAADGESIVLPRSPVSAVDSVTYFDSDGNETELESFQTLLSRSPAEVSSAIGSSWPATQERVDAVSIEFSCGYAEGSCPVALQYAILLTVERDFHEQTPLDMRTLDERIQALAAPFRIRDSRLVEVTALV